MVRWPNRMTFRESVVLVTLLMLLAACNDGSLIGPIEIDVDTEGIAGSGNVIVEAREVSDFDQVSLRGEGRVVVTMAGDEGLEVETDDNLLQYIDTHVTRGVLEISTLSGVDIDPSESVTYRVSMPAVSGLEISGAGSIESGAISGEGLRLEISGVGNVTVGRLEVGMLEVSGSGVGSIAIATGDVREASIAVSGVVDYVAGDLRCQRAVIDVSGTSSATLWVTDAIEIAVSDTATVSYFGLPGSVAEDVSGQGTVTELGDK